MKMTRVLWLMLMALSTSLLNTGWSQEDEEEPLVIRVYPVADLVMSPLNYRFPGKAVPTTEGQGNDPVRDFQFMGGGLGGMGGGMGGMGGLGGGGGMGGGGFFQVGSEGGGGSAGQGGGGLGGHTYGSYPPRPTSFADYLRMDSEALMDTIAQIIEPDSWQAAGGLGDLQMLGGSLVVSQTEKVHAQLEQLLSQLSELNGRGQIVLVHAIWMLLDEQQIRAVVSSETGAVDRKKLQEIETNPSTSYAHARLRCFSGQTVYSSSGLRQSNVTGLIPVVGETAAYNPIVSLPNLGIVFELTPIVTGRDKQITVDVQSTVTNSSRDGNKSAAITVHDGAATANGVNMHAHQFATTVRVKLNELTLVGGMTIAGDEMNKSQDASRPGPQLVMFMEVTQ